MKDKNKEKLEFMDWNECKKSFIRNIEVDNEKINSIIKVAFNRLNFIKDLEVNEISVSFIFEDYYEIIKELLIALLMKKGLRSKNHQCLITYFYKNYPNYGFEANLILRMSYLRNRLEYYGETVDIGFYKKYNKDFLRIIEIIEKLIKELN